MRLFFFLLFFFFSISEQSRWLLCNSEKLFIHFCTPSLSCGVLSSSSAAVGGELQLHFFLERLGVGFFLFALLPEKKKKLEVPS